MTANFDAAKSAALAVTMLDWRDYGADYAAEMILMARALAEGLAIEEALRHGAAAASAAVMTEGTALCRASDFDTCLPRCVLTRL